MQPTMRTLQGLVVMVILVVTRLGSATEVRQVDGTVHYFSRMTRAYAPCLAPNDVSQQGIAACSPPVTSSCTFTEATVDIARANGIPLMTMTLRQPPQAEPCENGSYTMRIAVRSTAESDEPACASGHCTFQDRDIDVPFFGALFLADLVGRLEPSHEILGVTLIAPDGLPMASSGSTLSSNLTVAAPPCTSPEPGFSACDAPPWDARCDFNAGTIDWTRTGFGLMTLAAKLSALAGSSSLCTTGTYLFQATVRATVGTCGGGSVPCTLVDRTVTMPVPANGVDVDSTTGLGAGGLNGPFTSAEILGTRVFDPTGGLLASSGVTNVRSLTKPRITMAAGKVRLQAIFPDEAVDAARAAGASFSITDRNGVVYAVVIPGARWQLQPPIGERWEYKDKGGVLNGVRKARIKRVRKNGTPIGYEVRLAADDVDLSAAGFPGVNLTVGIASVPGPPTPFDSDVIEAQRNRTCRVSPKKIVCR